MVKAPKKDLPSDRSLAKKYTDECDIAMLELFKELSYDPRLSSTYVSLRVHHAARFEKVEAIIGYIPTGRYNIQVERGDKIVSIICSPAASYGLFEAYCGDEPDRYYDSDGVVGFCEVNLSLVSQIPPEFV